MVNEKIVRVVAVMFAGAIVGAPTVSSAEGAPIFVLTITACTGGKNHAMCYETAGKEKLEEVREQETTTTSSTSLSATGPTGVTVVCTHTTSTSTIVQEDPLPEGPTLWQRILEFFGGCSITNPSEIAKKCQTNSELSSKELNGELVSGTEILVKPATGTVYMEVPITSKPGESCPATFLGTHNVTGQQQFTIENAAVAEETKHWKAVVKSKLEFFSAPAELVESVTESFPELGDKVYFSKEA